MGLKSTALFLALMLIGSATSWSQTIRQFTVNEGLPSSHVYEVKQDSKGFYWIATSEGLVRYDGYAIKPVADGNNPFSRDIWWSSEDSEGNILGLGHGTRLWYWGDQRFSFTDLPFPGFDESSVFVRQFQDQHDRHWFILGRHFYGLKGDKFVHLDLPEYLHLTKPVAHPEVITGLDGNAYIVSKNPVAVWSIDSTAKLHLVYEYETSLDHGELHYRASGKNEANTTVILKSPDSIYLVNKGQLTNCIRGVESSPGDFPSKSLLTEKSHRVHRLRNKFAFIQTNHNFITDLNFNHLPEFDFIKDLNINTVYQDHESSIWISTSDQGLVYVTKDAVASTNINTEDGSEVVSIEPSGEGEAWIAYKNGRVCKLKNGQVQCRELRSNHAMDKTWYLHNFLMIDNNVVLVVGDFELLHCPADKFLSGEGEYDKVIDFKGIKRMSRGLDSTFYVTDYWKSFQVSFDDDLNMHKSQLGGKKILATTKDAQNRMIISSYQGLYWVNSDGDTGTISKNVLVNRFEFKDSTLFVLDKSRGAHVLKGDSLISISALSPYLVKDLWFEGDSMLWAATNDGLIQLSLIQDSKGYHATRKLTTATGLPTNDVTAVGSDRRYLYIGTSQGFTLVEKAKLTGKVSGSEVQLTRVRSANKELKVKSEYTINPEDNAMSFDFVYISPRSSGQITYHFKLEGVDPVWRSSQETSVFYPFIPPGKHQFRLKATDIDGVPSRSEIMIDLYIKQYWYKTTWFLTLTVLSIAAMAVLLFRWRTRLQHERELEQADVNKRLADLKLNALRSQMNPHFVFNVLNSIQESFINDDIRIANKHLSDFSKLMRLFLETSNDKHNQLDKEIQILTHYIDLERMRLKNQFEYEFRIDEEIDIEEVFIPSMLLQPIIENAILHGLRYKGAKGTLTITIRQKKDGTLSVIIEDDGVGRKRSAEINARRKGSHKSMASTIIHERVELLNSGGTDKINMIIEDLTDGDLASGTRVSLDINLEKNN